MTDVEGIVELAASVKIAEVAEGPDGRHFLVTHQNCEVQEITDPHGLMPKRPSYVHASVTVQTAESLSEYVNRFKSRNTMLYADITASTIRAIIDYHNPPARPDGGEVYAEHAAHRATLVLPFSEEWRLWTERHGKLTDQLTFARFIEENASDIMRPVGGELLDSIRDLQAHRKVHFVKAVRTSSDNENFEWTDETNVRQTKGDVEIPTKFVLGIPVYFGEAPVEVHAFLRWKLDDGKLLLGIHLHRAEHVRQAEFQKIMLAIGKATDCCMVFGAP